MRVVDEGEAVDAGGAAEAAPEVPVHAQLCLPREALLRQGVVAHAVEVVVMVVEGRDVRVVVEGTPAAWNGRENNRLKTYLTGA